jgi:hypothetical protein
MNNPFELIKITVSGTQIFIFKMVEIGFLFNNNLSLSYYFLSFFLVLVWCVLLDFDTPKKEIHTYHKQTKVDQNKLKDFGTYQYVEYDVPGKKHKRYLIVVKTHLLRIEDLEPTLLHITNVYTKHPVYLKKLCHNILVQIEYAPYTFEKEWLVGRVEIIGERPIYSTSCIKENVRFFFYISLNTFIQKMIKHRVRYYNARRIYIVLDVIDGQPPL